MDPVKARSLANSEMRRWGLFEGSRPWTFVFNTRKTALGLCSPQERTIALSSYMIDKVSEVETLDTIRHEIAHALEYVRHGTAGHGPKWQAIAREVGAKPLRLYAGPKVSHDYTYVLKHDGKVYGGFHKLPADIHERLPRIYPKGRPDLKGKLKLFKVTYKK